MYSKLWITLFILLLTGCSSYTYRGVLPSEDLVGKNHKLEPFFDPDRVDSDGNPNKGLSYKSCDSNKYKALMANGSKRMPPESFVAAKKYYIYSLMSTNAYVDIADPQFKIPGWIRTDRYNSDNGLGFDVYEKVLQDGDKPTLVIAFRGTEMNSFKDMWSANIAVFKQGQYKEALKATRAYRDSLPNYKIIATGHSLGGALALNMSLRIDGIDAIVFNTSPRVTLGNIDKSLNNKRVMIRESGDVLQIVRSFYAGILHFTNETGWAARYSIEHFKVDYQNYNWNHKYKEHGAYNLARGLLITAVAQSDEAKDVFIANFDRDGSIDIDPLCKNIFDYKVKS